MNLLSLVVAIAIAGLVAYMLSNIAKNSIESTKSVTKISEIEELRNHVRQHLDCGTTISHANVGNIVLYNKFNKHISTVVSSTQIFGAQPSGSNQDEFLTNKFGNYFLVSIYTDPYIDVKIITQNNTTRTENLFEKIPLRCG